MRDVAIVAVAQAPSVRRDDDHNEVEMLLPVIKEVIARSGLSREDIAFTCSGSCDYLVGMAFSFLRGLDAAGAWPPIAESHVEQDGAWALQEAFLRLQHGDIDTALVYGFGKSSLGDLPEVLALQLDPYYELPLWPDAISLAALQARALLDSGRASERDMAEVAARSRRDALNNPFAQVAGEVDAEVLLKDDYLVTPLRPHDCPPVSDGAAAVVLAVGDVARELCDRPAWIRAIDQRIEPHSIGVRDLTRSPSTELAAEMTRVHAGKIDVAEIYAPFTHQELILREALGLDDRVPVNPSGGALAAHPFMAAGLTRVVEVATRIMDGRADRGLAHATSGPCLQHNLVTVLEA
jgi:acetyl-CoA acetyltransferase